MPRVVLVPEAIPDVHTWDASFEAAPRMVCHWYGLLASLANAWKVADRLTSIRATTRPMFAVVATFAVPGAALNPTASRAEPLADRFSPGALALFPFVNPLSPAGVARAFRSSAVPTVAPVAALTST